MNFERAVELRRQGYSYGKIAKSVGCSIHTVRNRFQEQYQAGRLLELSGYGASDPKTNCADWYALRGGPRLPVGGSVIAKLSQDEKRAAAVMMSKRGHRTLNDLLLELLRERI